MAKSINLNAASKKAGSALAGTGNFIKGNWQPLLYLGGAVVAIILVRRVVKAFDFGFGEAEEDREDAAKKQAGGVNYTAAGNPTDGSTAKISKGQASTIAQQQFNAMTDIGTNETTLVVSLEQLNGADLRLVYTEFGTVYYNGFGWIGKFGTRRDLFGWYDAELGNNSQYRAQLREIWAKSGLPITF